MRSSKYYNPFPDRITVVLVFVALLAWGCGGYHFRADGEPVGIELRSLAVPLVKSTSSTMGFEADFTRILREEFISHAGVPLVPVEKAQAVLSGRICEIETDPLVYDYQDWTVKGYNTTYEVTKSRRLIIRLDMRLTDRSTGEVVWRDRKLEEKARFAVGADPVENRYRQKKALEEVARKLAKRIYLRTMERF